MMRICSEFGCVKGLSVAQCNEMLQLFESGERWFIVKLFHLTKR